MDLIYAQPIDITQWVNYDYRFIGHKRQYSPKYCYPVPESIVYPSDEDKSTTTGDYLSRRERILNSLNLYCGLVEVTGALYLVMRQTAPIKYHRWLMAWGLYQLGLDLPLSLSLFLAPLPKGIIDIDTLCNIYDKYKDTLDRVNDTLTQQWYYQDLICRELVYSKITKKGEKEDE